MRRAVVVPGPFRLAALVLLAGLSLTLPARGADPPDYPARFIPELDTAALPPEARVYAVSGVSPRILGWPIDQSWQEHSGTIKVAVNSPDAPALLLLVAHQPVIWQIGWTEGTRILAVLADGDVGQIVTGLPPEVPVMSNDEEGGWLWRSYQWAEENGLELPKFDERRKELALKFFGRPVTAEVTKGHQQVVVGRPLGAGDRLLTLAVPLKETFEVELNPKPKGRAAIRRGLLLNELRKAEKEETDRWLEKRAELVRRRTAEAEGWPEHLVPTYKYQDDQELLDRLAPPCKNGRPKRTCGWYYAVEVYVPLKPDFVPPEQLTGRPIKFLLPADFPLPAGPLDDKVHLLLMKDGRILSNSDYKEKTP